MFATGLLNDIQAVGGGERAGLSGIDITHTVFEDSLKAGRFAKLDTASIDNMDGSATPVIAGVVLRNPANATENGAVYDTDLYRQVDVRREGLVTVDVKSGETPAMFDRVYVSNAGDANDGLATATNTDVAVNGEFIKEVKSGVWLIYITPAPADISAHTGDAAGAHAASAISVTAGNILAATEVEAALAELAKYIPLTLADPGTGVAIPVTRSASIAITTAAAETNTLAIPTFVGQKLMLHCTVYAVGDRVITASQPINQANNTIMTFGAVSDAIVLEAITLGGALVWQVTSNDGVALS